MNSEKIYVARAWNSLESHGFHFTHSLGQNFLLDDAYLSQIVDSAEAGEGCNVLEIGPGAGVLTAIMASRGAKVTAIELDKTLQPVLREVLEGLSADIVYEDVMKCDLESITRKAFGGEAFQVVANLPYYITSDILTMLTRRGLPIASITVLVQKEAAERILSVPGEKSYSALAATVRYFGTAQAMFDIPPEAFVPKPHVVSTLLKVTPYAERPFAAKDEALLQRLIPAAFAMRRKTLVNNLTSAFALNREAAEQVLANAGVDVKIRGEALSMEEFCRVSDALEDRLTNLE